MILLVDNHDSFTFNVYQQVASLFPGDPARVRVVRNDACSAEALVASNPEAVILSPGPGRPEDAGVCTALVSLLPESTPILGVCLGHQVLIEHEGGRIERDPIPVHGRPSPVEHSGHALFEGFESPFLAGRYHSLRAATPVPESLEVLAWTGELVMAVGHRELPRFGVQFHPESILTPNGRSLFANFLNLAGTTVAPAGGTTAS